MVALPPIHEAKLGVANEHAGVYLIVMIRIFCRAWLKVARQVQYRRKARDGDGLSRGARPSAKDWLGIVASSRSGVQSHRGEDDGDDGVSELLPPCGVRGEVAVDGDGPAHGAHARAPERRG